MTIKTSLQAQKQICHESIIAGEPYLCFGDGCTAWVEIAFDAAHDGDDITPKGECGLLMARLTVAGGE